MNKNKVYKYLKELLKWFNNEELNKHSIRISNEFYLYLLYLFL